MIPDPSLEQAAKRMLIFEEGDERFPYDDTNGQRARLRHGGRITIGIGHNLDAVPLSVSVRDMIFREDLEEAWTSLRAIFHDTLHAFTQTRQLAMIGLMFHLGINRFMEFEKLIAAAKDFDWGAVIAEMWDSKMGREPRFKNRLTRMETLFRGTNVEEY